jgi:uncharacterized iron-regulated membrane protein
MGWRTGFNVHRPRVAVGGDEAERGLSKDLRQAVAKGTLKRTLRTAHLWLALILFLPIVVIGISGSALLIQSHYWSRTFPAATATGPKQTILRAIEAARAAGPQDARLGRVDLSVREGQPVAVQLNPPGRGVRSVRVYVDPVSLEVLGTREVVPRGQALGFLINIHSFLMMRSYVGVKVVGALGVVMILMAISGLVLWWPKQGQWRRAFLVRRCARGLPLYVDLHHAAGIWTVVVLLIMSVSGVYLCFPQTVTGALTAVLPSALGSGEPVVGFVPTPGPLDADTAVASAVTAVPDARAIGVLMPEQAGRPILVFLETTRFGGATQPQILVTLDQATGDIGYVDDPRDHGMVEQVVNLQNALHYGSAYGTLWQIVVFVSGLLPLFFAITGLSIWWARRRVTARASEPAVQSAPAE